MCGIAGILSFNNKKLHFENIELMTQFMRHRGPDDEGMVFFTPGGNAKHFGGKDTPGIVYKGRQRYLPNEPFRGNYPDDTFLAFGHRRLSIIDISDTGHQPMCTEDGRYWIIYNGEIYNYKELRPELEKEGDVFISNSDTEVILNAYRRWGPDCLKRFNGMWAFAIWDNVDKKLFCSRDRIGIKPFYYYKTNDYFLFASDIKTLIASKLYHPEINYEGLWHNLSFSIAPRPMTCFKDVFALEQAHWIFIDPVRGITQKKRYWDIPIGTQDNTMKEAEAVELLEYELERAIRYQLIADVDVGTFISGGIDSTTISAMASKLHPGINAFTLGFDKSFSELDELDQASATAKMHPMKHIVKIVQFHDIINEINNMTLCSEEPNFTLLPDYVLFNLFSENNIKVVLNGLGADELFAGYGYYKTVRYWEILQQFKVIIAFIPNGLYRKIDTAKAISTLEDVGQFYARCQSAISEEDKIKLFNHHQKYNSLEVINSLYNRDRKHFTDNIEALSYFDLIHYIGNHHVYRADQSAMHFSVEGRFPFLDHNLIEAAFKIPTKYKLRNGLQKFVLRKVAEKYIHPSCLSMKKKGFTMPSQRWFDNELASIGQDNLNYLKKTIIFKDSDHFEKIVNKNRQKFILIALWHKAFFEGS